MTVTIDNIPVTPPPEPIGVKANVTTDVTAQTLRVFLLGFFAFGAGQFVHSELVLATIIPVAALIAGFVATYIVGLKKLFDTHTKLKVMASWLPDRFAKLR